MLYNRFWFFHDYAGLTLGGGFIRNPGRYLVLTPPPAITDRQATATPGQSLTSFTQNPGDQFWAWDCSITADYMPSQYMTFRLEYIHRWASVPYFAGPGGVTSPDGYSTTAITPGWQPDLVNAEDRISLAILFRL
jgi:hypothetical protein